uniref:hypothetical protein n=1 Tax=Yoonia sp. TaxID=2212373 RepID=UPI004047F597
MSLGCNWSYTVNNYTPANVVDLQAIPCTYHVFGYETGASGTPHLQGTICFAKNVRLSKVLKLIPGHIELTRNKEASILYCKKEGNFWEEGSVPLAKSAKTSDSITFDNVNSLDTWEDVLRIPGIACKMSWAKEVWRKKVRPLGDLPSALHAWQVTEVNNLLLQGDRKIRFIVDYKGGLGKTVLAKFLVQSHGAFYTRGGKHSDIAYAYDFQPIVVFDMSRANEEAHWPYPVMECFKDGMLFSGKYESLTKSFPSCKVIVLCNEMPDETKLSKDRYDIWEANALMN